MRKNKPTVCTVIVNWNGITDTLACLRSLSGVSTREADLSIIVVDNGSSDNSPARIRKEFPGITVLETGKNLGFTGGNNVGITHALNSGADFIWLLNNDTIVDPQVLSFMHAFDDPKTGACGCKIYFAPGHEYHAGRYTKSDSGHVIWYAGGLIDWNNMYASHRGVDEVDRGQYDTDMPTEFITGCSFIIRASVVRQVGMLDDAYYLYLEDFDWSMRIRRAGYATMYSHRSVLWHINAGSSGKPGNPLHEYYFTRNRILAGFRYAPARTRFALAREALRFVLTGGPVRRRAVFDACTGRFGKQYDPKNIH